MKKEPEPPIDDSESFDRFDRLFRQIVAVPKAVVEKAENKERQKNQRLREKRKRLKQQPA